jgi:hypothetical protein
VRACANGGGKDVHVCNGVCTSVRRRARLRGGADGSTRGCARLRGGCAYLCWAAHEGGDGTYGSKEVRRGS